MKMKKWLSLLLAMVMVLGMGTLAFAAGSDDDDDDEPVIEHLALATADSTYSGQEEGLVFTLRGAELKKFEAVQVDLEELGGGYTLRRDPDKKDTYTLTLSDEFLDSLGKGDHTLTVDFWQAVGGCVFTVQ